MRRLRLAFMAAGAAGLLCGGAEPVPPFPVDPASGLERTCFQTGQGYSGSGNLRSDVAIVYGIDPGLPGRIKTWRDRGYRIHVMTGVSWGQYQDYLYGRFDGINHEDEAQTDRRGQKISHGGDIYYMCPGTNYGRFLATGVQRALDAGADAIHLEEPEFWVRGGYSEGFKREWASYYQEPWQPPNSSVDAQWRASQLKYFLYRRALQQVFDHVQAYNRRTGRQVRCYVPTHSLLNYAHWRIVSPESSLARLQGCDGYIAQVWTGTSRSPNLYRGVRRERTFETAFLEYGAMQNLVRSTGRTVWYLNDPIEDDPKHDWTDYRTNWESTLVASLLQPEVFRYEVAPWPERVFHGRYPANSPNPQPIPGEYATELQLVMNALNDMRQSRVEWEAGLQGVGILVSDSLMFQRGEPAASDEHLGNVYGLALPLLKRGIPVTPVQLENVTIDRYLSGFRILFLSYHGMKPLSPEVHPPLAAWVRGGGVLIVCDDDSDPYNRVRAWWNAQGTNTSIPRQALFQALGLADEPFTGPQAPAAVAVGDGAVIWVRRSPAALSRAADGDQPVVAAAREAARRLHLEWRESAALLLRRGPYVVAAAVDESESPAHPALRGRWINLFDPNLAVQHAVPLDPGSRRFLVDLDQVTSTAPTVVASACKVLPRPAGAGEWTGVVEGVPDTGAVVLLSCREAPRSVSLEGSAPPDFRYSAEDRLLWVRFPNQDRPRALTLRFP